ncbi:unnamed protein product [Linum trigynum]|uniref:Strictosidine synthase conserved region domain-containing protein n=1 Tax=Linum trigynum TaxID=586398 RepID=A0AAV2C7T6_9ROSI
MKPKLCLYFATATLAVAISSLILLLPPNLNNYGRHLINYYYNKPAGDRDNTAGRRRIEFLPLDDGSVGPESFAFGGGGVGPFTGVSGGRVVKWVEEERRWSEFAVTSSEREGCDGLDPPQQEEMEPICGRPLGLSFRESNGDLYVADAYMGLLRVGPRGGLADRMVTRVDNTPLVFTNGLDTDQSSDVVYFTDSSSRFQRRMHLLIVITGDSSGRFIKYDPKTQQATVLASDLMFPNGVALSHDGKSVLVVETTNCRVLKYGLQNGEMEVFAELDGYPDNIKRSPTRGYWVGLYSKRTTLLKWLVSIPWIGKSLVKLVPLGVIKRVKSMFMGSGNVGLGVRLSESGEVVEVFNKGGDGGDDCSEEFGSISEIMENDDGELWVGSVESPFAARVH